MDKYCKAVLDLVKDGPKRRQWLYDKIVSNGIMGKRKFQDTLNDLENEGKLHKDSRVAESGRWEAWYMLPNHKHLLDVNATIIKATIEHLKSLLMRMPTVDEIAVEAGIIPSEAEPIIYRLAHETGWYKPTPELILSARAKLGEILVCAARIKQELVAEDGKSEKFDYDKDAEIVEAAKCFLKDHLNLLPSLSDDAEEVKDWSQEALRFLGDNYVPKDRVIPRLWVIPR